MARNFSRRVFAIVHAGRTDLGKGPGNLLTRVCDHLFGSRWAPPSGSAIMPSITLSSRRSWAVMRMLVAASASARRVVPEDGGGPFRRDHRIDGMFQHVDLVGGGDRDGVAGARPRRWIHTPHMERIRR